MEALRARHAFTRRPVRSALLSLLVMTSCSGQSGTPAPEPATTSGEGDVVGCGLQDRQGRLWFGSSEQGLFLVDGTSLSRITRKEGLCDDHVLSMLEDRDGGLWLGTRHGICRYDGKTFSAMPVPDELRAPDPDTVPAYSSPPGWIISIFQGRNGDLWFGTTGWGAYRYDGRLFSRLSTQDGLCGDVVQVITEDADGNIWFATRGGGVCRYDGRGITSFRSPHIQDNHIVDVLEDRSGHLWFSTMSGGIRHFRGTWADLRSFDGEGFETFYKGHGLNSDNTSAILQDRHGNLWFATNGGVSRYDGTAFTHSTTADGLGHHSVWSIVEDRDGHLWFGTRHGGLYRYDGRSFTPFAGPRR